ncbi:hypothetical protein [Salmonella enterica]|uniref:hypothetical protein n=1 Tax=Salmonella enterica TaxID=28901 RepID=UPI0022B2A865|nr:hypothetical protein [Salmonella enterica]
MWTPDNRNRPGHFSAEERSWVSEHVLSAPSPAVRTHLCVGSLEGSTVPQVKSCMKNCAPPALKAIAACTPAVTIMPGGGALIDGLRLLPR